jgi:hypothetical protein
MSDKPVGVMDLSTEEAINVHCYKAGIILLDNYKCKINVITSQNYEFHVFCTVNCNVIIQYEPTTFSKLIFSFLIL